VIPDEAVEAAQKAWCGSADLRDWQRRHIHKLLEAAAPFIAAQAVRSAAHAFGASSPEGDCSCKSTRTSEGAFKSSADPVEHATFGGE
jgi:hypothetical protein